MTRAKRTITLTPATFDLAWEERNMRAGNIDVSLSAVVNDLVCKQLTQQPSVLTRIAKNDVAFYQRLISIQQELATDGLPMDLERVLILLAQEGAMYRRIQGGVMSWSSEVLP